jgi:predicted TIM-barrel fold metal-dependent hydrolase
MQLDDLILVSIDDHVIEPADMFERHVPAKYRDQAPKIITTADGIEQWEFQGTVAGSMGLNAVVTWPKEEWGLDPIGFAEMRPGAYDIHERVRDMNRNGILASMCFPTFVGFSAGVFEAAADKDLALVMLQAYNDWHIDEWAASYPGRFIPLAIAPVWDPQAMAAEMRRVAAKGCKAVSMPELPHIMGLPSYHDLGFWAPFFEAVSELGIVMCLHIGQGFGAIKSAPDAPIDNMIILATQVSAFAAQDLLWGPAMRTYPDLKIAWSEAGIGWIPFYLDRIDRHYENQTWLDNDFGGKLPSEVFREHFLACYISDPSGLMMRHQIGIDTIAWECDYPHTDTTWPRSPESAWSEFQAAQCTESEIHKITWENATRFFGWDAFAHTPREEATVGALRALATDVDTSVMPRAQWRLRNEAAGIGLL